MSYCRIETHPDELRCSVMLMNIRIMHVFHAKLGLGILETLFKFFTLNVSILTLSHTKFKFSSISICIVMPELENSQFITMEVLKEMLAMQKDSYQMSVKMLVEDIRQEVRHTKRSSRTQHLCKLFKRQI